MGIRALALIAVIIFARTASPPGRETARDALLRRDTEFARLSAEKGLEGFLSFVADDATFLPNNAARLQGREAIRAAFAPLFATPGFSLDWKPTRAEVSSSGDLGYTLGTYEASSHDVQGRRVGRPGKYVTIWKKQGGKWKAVVDIGNPDPPRQAESAR